MIVDNAGVDGAVVGHPLVANGALQNVLIENGDTSVAVNDAAGLMESNYDLPVVEDVVVEHNGVVKGMFVNDVVA